MAFEPLIDMRSTSIRKAFILNAIVLAVVASASPELRKYIDIRIETKDLTEPQKIGLTMIGSFVMGFSIYVFVRILFGLGEGMTSSPPWSKTLL